ncbi:hypothetical protein [Actinoplanes sp. NPDC049265]|uniref:hypothetical protein n=1 Tax=Actinoplanes sp. NPDC049265 TaxID=3363902 RepID=UPI00371023BE
MTEYPLLIVDAANVVGSKPDGWWRDRAGAAERLRDGLVVVARDGLADVPGPLDVLLIVEGKAKGIKPIPGVRVESAPNSGDDAIVDAVDFEDPERRVIVVTADRELRRRVIDLGAEVRGPSSVPR